MHAELHPKALDTADIVREAMFWMIMHWTPPLWSRTIFQMLLIENKRPKIHRVVVALDCGLAVNPLTIESQFQGGIAFGLTQLVAKGAITLKDGRVEQANFDTFTPPYVKDAPVAIDVHIVPSIEGPRHVVNVRFP